MNVTVVLDRTTRARALAERTHCDCELCVTNHELLAEGRRLVLADAVGVLTARVPDWRDRVRPDELDMGNPARCVLGQVFGGYVTGLHALYGADATGPGVVAFAGLFPVDLWRDELRADPARRRSS